MQGVAVVCGILWDVFVRFVGYSSWCWQGNHLSITYQSPIDNSREEGYNQFQKWMRG